MRLLSFVLVVASTNLFGAYNFPILQKRLGGLDRARGLLVTHDCQIFDDHADLGKKLDQILKLASEAEKEPIQKAVDIQQEVPSVEVWVNIPTRLPGGPSTTILGSRKVLLLQDSSHLQTRSGQAAEKLLKLVQDNCKDLKD